MSAERMPRAGQVRNGYAAIVGIEILVGRETAQPLRRSRGVIDVPLCARPLNPSGAVGVVALCDCSRRGRASCGADALWLRYNAHDTRRGRPQPAPSEDSMLRHTFCHLPGVGPKKEQRRWSAGLATWDDALASPQRQLKAERLLESAR